ncbi:MAG: DJ-1/PfpI family protein [Clostridia bacterium]|nr:DJ-1/PfpI family protein [Clostridia bacterium]
MVTVFLAEGFEEIEAVTPIDILRRGEVQVRTCSITSSKEVVGAHGIPFLADTVLEELSDSEDVILLPGGMPGTLNLKNCAKLRERILSHYAKGGYLAAICAAPTIFGEMGLLSDKEAVCYPGMEDGLFCKKVSESNAVLSERIITSRGAGTASDFGFLLLSLLKGEECAQTLARQMCFEGEKN